jgi:hypothetical protein
MVRAVDRSPQGGLDLILPGCDGMHAILMEGESMCSIVFKVCVAAVLFLVTAKNPMLQMLGLLYPLYQNQVVAGAPFLPLWCFVWAIQVAAGTGHPSFINAFVPFQWLGCVACCSWPSNCLGGLAPFWGEKASYIHRV